MPLPLDRRVSGQKSQSWRLQGWHSLTCWLCDQLLLRGLLSMLRRPWWHEYCHVSRRKELADLLAQSRDTTYCRASRLLKHFLSSPENVHDCAVRFKSLSHHQSNAFATISLGIHTWVTWFTCSSTSYNSHKAFDVKKSTGIEVSHVEKI